MEKQVKRFIITLSIVLFVAYSIIMSAVGIHSFIKAQNLKQQIFSLTLVRQELERKTEEIFSQLQDYEKEKMMLDRSLERMNKESEEKLNQITSQIQTYESKTKELTESLKKTERELLVLKKENKLLKEAPLKEEESTRQLEETLTEKESQISELQEKVSSLKQELKNKGATLHYNLAVNFSQRKDFGSAVIEYEKALSIDPDHFSSHYNLGILYEEYKEDYSQAIFHYRRYVHLCPDSPETPQVKRWVLDLEAKQVGFLQE